MKKIIKDELRCDNAPYCGAKLYCPTGAIVYDRSSHKILINEEKCTGCGKCTRFCPHRALSIGEA